jgi:ABC-2 type transport system ATP-binding protein
VRVIAMTPADIPMFSVRTPADGGLPPVPGRYLVEFALDRVPPLNGRLNLGVQVEHAVTGLPITARRFDDVLGLAAGPLPGLVHVDATATCTRTAPLPDRTPA